MAATLALVALTMMIPGAEASRLIVYSGNNFSGASATVDACGCSNIPYRGSYRYYAEGQSTRLYNEGDCRGPVHTTLATNQNAQMTTGFGWNSAFIAGLVGKKNPTPRHKNTDVERYDYQGGCIMYK
ncbi:hypothetical protein Scep_025459 [Stephania cephalantha]|uniref:Uncharacterized protein n=1 Tax=Stephania cephalantha TaxID=152367 RepID=A0AAP0HSG9_9MAGN